jgi:hypothetical protein
VLLLHKPTGRRSLLPARQFKWRCTSLTQVLTSTLTHFCKHVCSVIILKPHSNIHVHVHNVQEHWPHNGVVQTAVVAFLTFCGIHCSFVSAVFEYRQFRCWH